MIDFMSIFIESGGKYKKGQNQIKSNCINRFPLMISEKDREERQTEQLIRQIYESNKTLDEWSQCLGDRLLQQLQSKQQQGMIDIGKLTFQDETNDEMVMQKASFFSQIPSLHIDQQTQQRILNFKLNFMSARRKDELFKNHRKQQEQKFTSRKREMEKHYAYKLDNFRNIKGEFTLKKGDQVHTCSITGDDLDKLKPETDLNDTIIANYLKYLQTEIFTEQLDKNMFIYSSFFIQKLVGEMLREEIFFNQKDLKFLNQKIKIKVAQNFKNIKRWTRRTDIFEKEHLIIPINAFKHWYCIIVVNPGSIIDPKPDKKPYIVNCDSMFEKKFFIIDAIRMYLQVELQDKKSIKIEITESNFPSYQLLLPRQTNTHDCGLYTLTYIQHLLSNKKQLEDLHIIQNRQKLHIFPRTIIYTMRQRLKQLFINLIQNSDETLRKEILNKYKEETQKIIRQADQSDYDQINLKQFKKYEAMNSYLLQSTGYNVSELTEEELQFACKIKFYLDPEVNFYQRDKPFLM